jgi:fructose-specific component phosphotransferase system IIB-like protein
MSSVKSARKSAIHRKAIDITKAVSNVNSTLNGHMSEVLIYAAAMHKINLDAIAASDTDMIIDAADVAFYDAAFNEQVFALNATLARLLPLLGLQTGEVTKADYIASVNQTQLTEYIDAFDKA